MEKKYFHRSTALETLVVEGLRTLGYLERIEGMARIGQSILSATSDQYETFNVIIRYAQEATAHIRATLEAVNAHQPHSIRKE